MVYPLEAFSYVDISTVEPGTIVADDSGSWFLVARKHGMASNQAIRLTVGPHGGGPGDLLSSPDGCVFAVAHPYSTSIRVDDLFDLRKTLDGHFPGTILLAQPLAIYTVDTERHLISLAGQEIDEETVHRLRARFMKWSVWLIDPQGRKVGDQPLVEVDAAGR